MDQKSIEDVLKKLKKGELNIKNGAKILMEKGFVDIHHTKIDTDRESRVGYPEVIYCAGKSEKQVLDIINAMNDRKTNILATRVSPELQGKIKTQFSEAEINSTAKTITIKHKKLPETKSTIAIITGGTSDLPVAEEAYVTAQFYGNKTMLISDVGVAGIHRLFNHMENIKSAKVVVVVAGMEGALASVVSGLVDKPVIAVPTSVGYGANFEGLAALLSMLNTCSPGVSVVNIDNGFGAGYQASMINKLK